LAQPSTNPFTTNAEITRKGTALMATPPWRRARARESAPLLLLRQHRRTRHFLARFEPLHKQYRAEPALSDSALHGMPNRRSSAVLRVSPSPRRSRNDRSLFVGQGGFFERTMGIALAPMRMRGRSSVQSPS
jgi:hypothetical protein